MIPLAEPVIFGNEYKYVKNCFDTGWISSVGSYVDRFEKVVADYAGLKYATACINGTSALHLALIACGVKPGDEVIVPALTFIAPVNAVSYCRAIPVFMDCNLNTLCMDIDKLERFIDEKTVKKEDGFTYNKDTHRRIRAIIPVHIFGHPVDMSGLMALCNKNNIDIVEDAAESLGSEYKGVKTGSFGKAGCFSFNGNKIITTGGGGMIVTNDSSIALKTKHLSTQAKKGGTDYFHDDIGYNYRLSNISAAVGVAQMERIDEMLGIKRNNAELYKNLLTGIEEVELLWEQDYAKSNFWFYTIRVNEDHKDGLIEWLIKGDIQVRPVWRLIHTLPMYSNCQAYDIRNAVNAFNSCINLPCSTNITREQIETVVEGIRSYFKGLI